MDTIEYIGNIVLLSYYMVFPLVGLIAIACLVVGQRARHLCVITSWLTSFFLLLTWVWLAYRFISSGWKSEEGQFIFSLFFMAFLPVVGELLALLAIYRWRMKAPAPLL
jgi:hypothetical protein